MLASSHLFGDGGHKPSNAVQLRGTVVLAKKGFLDVQNKRADLEDTIADNHGHKVNIRLVSVDLDPATKRPKVSEASSIQDFGREDDSVVTEEDEYSITFQVPSDFGEPGAFLVANHHPNEFFLTSLSLDLPGSRTIHFFVESVVYPRRIACTALQLHSLS